MFAAIKRCRLKKRLAKRWPTALGFLVGLLETGLSVDEALRVFRSEAPEPFRSYFESLPQSRQPWLPLSERVEALFAGPELALVRSSLLLSARLGSPAAPLIDRAAAVLLQKQRLADRLAVLTTQGAASAWTVGLSPVFIFVSFLWLSPEDAHLLLGTSVGRWLILLSAFLVAVGLVMVKRMTRLRV